MNIRILLIFCLLPIITFAQGDLYISEFTDPSMFHFVGNAKLFNKRIRLTDATYNQGGGIWLKEKRNVAQDFSIQIGFQITQPGNSGADGIAFVIQNQKSDAIGIFGGGIGYAGIPNSLAIEFDTYPNSEYRDPNDNHIGIQTRGKNANSADHAITLGTSRNIPQLEDGTVHVMRIDYVNKVMKVYLDEFNTPKITAYVNIDSLLDLDNGKAWLGFTSSTGGAFANHDIVSFGHKSNSKISIEGLNPAGTLCPNQLASLIGFTSDSANVISWTWILPGETKNGKIVSFSRPIPGTYPIQLIIKRSVGILVDTLNTTITVENRASVEVNDTTICEENFAEFFANVQNTQGAFTYTWQSLDGPHIDGLMNGESIKTKNMKPGTYRFEVYVRDIYGCEDRDTAMCIVRTLPIIQKQSIIQACAGEIVQINPLITSSSGTLTYRWFPIDGVIGSVFGSTLTVKKSEPGIHEYSVTIKDALNCSVSYTYQIQIASKPILNGGNDVKVFCIGDTIEIGSNAKVSGGTPPFRFEWKRLTPGKANIVNPYQASTLIYPTIAGNYELSVTDSNGCVDADTVFADVRLIPDANAGPDITECVCDQKGGMIGIPAKCGVIPFTYRWSALNNAPLSALSALDTIPVMVKVNENPIVKTSYGYILTVTDGQNVSRSDTVFYTLNPCPKVDAGRSQFICSPIVPFNLTPTVIADPSDSLRYEWTPSTFLSDPNNPRPLVTLPDSTISITYTLNVFTPFGCIGSDTVNFQTEQSMSLSLTKTDTNRACICRGDSVILNALVQGGSAPYKYEWIPIGLQSSSSFCTVSPLINTLYTVRVIDARGCSISDTISVCVEPVPNPRPASDTTICFGDITPKRGETATCGKAPFTYAWSPTTGIDDSTIHNPRFSPDTSTVYSLTVTDAGGMSTTAYMVINVRPKLAMTIKVDSLMCKGGSITALVNIQGGTPPYIPNWKINGLPVSSTDTLLSVMGLDADFTIECTITDSANCTISAQKTVKVSGPDLTFPDQVFVCPCDSVIIGGEAIGGTPNYLYEWTDLDGLKPLELRDSTLSTTICSPSRSREYLLRAIDANGCSVTRGVSVVYDAGAIPVSLSIPNIKAHPLEKKARIPIIIENYPDSLACPPKVIDFIVKYDPWIFDPAPQLSHGRIIENTVINRVRTLRIRIDSIPRFSSGDTLITLTGSAIMGDPGQTDILIDSISWPCSRIVSTTAKGIFSLDSLCVLSDSSIRLFDFAGMPFMQSIKPIPATGQFTVSAIRFHGEEVQLTLFDARGAELEKKVWQEQNIVSIPEQEAFTFTGDWTAGVYRIVLQSKYGRDSQQCIIIR